MRQKQKKSTPIVFICSIIAGIFILTGCYLKQKPTGHFTAGHDAIGPKKILQNDWDKFFSDVKKVDGRAKAHYDMAVYFQKRKNISANNRKSLSTFQSDLPQYTCEYSLCLLVAKNSQGSISKGAIGNT